MKYLLIFSFPFLLLSCGAQQKNDYVEPKVENKESQIIAPEIIAEPVVEKQSSQDRPTDESGKFWLLDTRALNEQLVQKTTEISPEEIMRQYYAAEMYTREGNETLEVTQTVLSNGNTEVKLIHDFLQDDSVSGVQQLMELHKKNGRWTVVTLKRNWKCWKNRGHQDWSVEACL